MLMDVATHATALGDGDLRVVITPRPEGSRTWVNLVHTSWPVDQREGAVVGDLVPRY